MAVVAYFVVLIWPCMCRETEKIQQQF